MKIKEALCFDDVLLVPKKSEISSRTQISLNTSIGKKTFSLPIISSPMDTVTEKEMCLKMFSHGGLGIVHRYNTINDQCNIVRDIYDHLEQTSNESINSISAAIGVNDDFQSRSLQLYNSGVRIFCVDVAHGHHSLVERALKYLKDKFGSNTTIIAGNVATPEGYVDLSNWGADAVRVGIGGGSICSTRIQTGHGVPTLQSVIDCGLQDGASIIADGGIKTTGDIVKAIAAGADMVMLGSMLAGTDESPGDIFKGNNGNKYKVYRGMASPEAQISWRGKARSLEGISTTIPYKGPVTNILSDISQNIKSGLSYSGADSISKFQARSTFVRQSNAGLSESKTHILLRK
tara:strand:- start:1076 stop:2116 length:1041 start_codon:yes stop_codon:yes gene_type:complete